MRFFVVDLKKNRLSVTLVGILLTFIVLLSTVISIIVNVLGEDLFIEAAGDLSTERVIIIDAGHGGEDCGAVGVTGVLEKDLNLIFSTEIGDMLKDAGYTVVYTRTEDKMLYLPEENVKGLRKISDLKNRCKIVEQYTEPLFVSIHMNSFGDSRYSGLQVYYSESNTESRLLADYIQNMVKDSVQQKNNRVIKPGNNIYLLKHISSPAVLIECGFLTNNEECKKLSEKEYQKQLSFSIVCGIIEYMNAGQS